MDRLTYELRIKDRGHGPWLIPGVPLERTYRPARNFQNLSTSSSWYKVYSVSPRFSGPRTLEVRLAGPSTDPPVY